MMSFPHSPLDIFEDPFLHAGFEPRFGLALAPSDFNTRMMPRPSYHHHLPTGYHRPWSMARRASNELSKEQKNLHFGKDGFQACVDVHHFQPSEISVKTLDNVVVIEGKHEERDDGHGSVQRHFVRKYSLPKEYDMNSVQSSLSSDGVLTVRAPPPPALCNGEKHVAITHTNAPAHLSIKQNKDEKQNGAPAAAAKK